jgi:hypothetical protein
MAISADKASPFLVPCFVHMLNNKSRKLQTSSSDITRRPYTRPVLTINITPMPKHWDVVTSGDTDLDINEEDGYVLSATGEGSAFFVPCDALSGIRTARRGRRIKSQVLYRRRLSANLTSPTSNITCTTVSPASLSSL